MVLSKNNRKENIKSSVKITRILIAIMMVLSTLSILAIFSSNVAAVNLGPADLSISVVGDSKKYQEPGKWTSFTLRLTNSNSNYDAWVNLTIIGGTTHPDTTKNWRSTLDKSTKIVVERSRTTDVRLDVRVGAETFNDTSKATHVERVEIKGEFYDRGDSTFQAAGTFSQNVDVEVLQVWQFEFTNKLGEPQTKVPNAAGQVQFNFTINNTGNGEDTFTFKVEGAPGTALLPTTDVKAYFTRDVTLYINNIKDTVEAGYHYVVVKAQSENSSVSERQAGINVHILPTYDLDVRATEATTKNIEANKVAYYNFTIENKGNADDKIDVTSGIIGSAPGWDVSVTYPSSGHTILRNGSSDLNLEVEAPLNATYPKTVQVFVNVSSQKDPTVYQYIDTIKAKIIQKSDINIITDNQKQINKTYQASFLMDVYNKGNGEDTFEFELSGNFPSGELWNYNFNPPSVTLGAKGQGNDYAQVYLNFTAPEDAQYGDFNLTIIATSEQDPSVTSQKSVIISVGKLYNFDITRLVSEKQSAYPGDTISIRIRGENVGNFQDTFNFEDVVPTGAEEFIGDFEPDVLDLNPGEIGYVYYNLTVDDNAPQGFYIFQIRGYPSKAESKVDSFTLNISVKPKYEIKLIVIENESNADPGTSASFNFTVQNKGTGSCNVSMDAIYQNYIDVTITPSTFELPTASSTKKVWVNITPSASNPLAPMNQDGERIILTADIDEKEGGPEVTEDYWVNINQVYDVNLFADTININPKPGTSVSLNITITNDGNGEDSFGIALPAVRTGWDVKPYDPITMLPKYNTDPLQQSAEEKILIKVTIPSKEAHISVPIEINVSSRGGDGLPYEIETVNVNVDITRGAKFVGDNSSKVEPGSFVLFNITLENIGTINDTYSLDVVQPWPDFIDFNPLSPLFIEFGQRNSTILNISVDDSDVESLPPDVTIILEAANSDKSVIIQQPFFIGITEVRGVRISSSPNWQKGKPKETLTYNITVENTGTGDDRFSLDILTNLPYSGWANLKNIGDYTNSLAPGEITYVEVEVEIPAKQNPGQGQIYIKAASKENPEKTHTINFSLSIEAIYKLQVSVEPATQKVNPGENVTYTISIKNVGTSQDNITLTDTPTENGESISKGLFSEEYFLINPSQTRTVDYTVFAISEPEADKLIAKIEVKATSEEDTADPPTSDIEIIEFEIKPTVDIELEVTEIKKDVTPNLSGTKAEVEYTIKVWNRGLGSDSFEITEVNNHGYKVEIDPTTTNPVAAGSSAIVTVRIIIDNKASMSQTDYNTTITVTSEENEDKFEITTLKTRILQSYGVELQAVDKTLETGETLIGNNRIVSFDLDVRNLGTGEDTILFELSGDYANWGSLNESSYDMVPKERRPFTVNVKIPRETLVGDYSLILKATSQGDDDKYDDSDAYDDIKLTVTVTQFYEVELDPGETIKTGLPGDTIEFSFWVVNRGNGEDDVELKKSNYNLNWLWTINPRSPTLQPTGDSDGDDRREIKLTADIPTDEHGKTGLYNISIRVYSTSTTGEKIVHNQPLEFTVKVDAVYDMDLILEFPTSTDDQKKMPGKKIDYRVTLKNKGNDVDTFKLTLTGSKASWVDLPDSTVTMAAYSSKIINFTINIPDLTDVDDPEDIKAQKYTITLRATSDGDPDKFEDLNINPTVDEEYEVELESDLSLDSFNRGLITTNPNADPEYESFSLTITNNGNTKDIIQLRTKGSSDWTIKYKTTSGSTSMSTSITLDIGRSETITIQVFAPSDAENGDTERLTIEAKSENGEITDSFTIEATAETAKILFGNLEVTGDTSAGSKVTVKLTVRNDGDVEAEDLEIKFYDKGKLIHTEKIDELSKKDETEIQFTHELTEGDHKIEARADWSDRTIKKSQSFSSEAELLSADMLWILIIVVGVVLFIIGITLASISYRRGIPADLREEIAMAKQASRMGKSPEEISEMRRKRFEKSGDKKKPGIKTERETPRGEEEGPGPRKKVPGKAVKIKCPKCDRIQAVTTPKRPIEFPCSNCGMKLVLKK